jgi:two-component system sensor histidine kinase ResE
LLSSLGRVIERLFSRTYREAEHASPSQVDLSAIRASAILKSLAEGVVVQDLDGRIVMMNDPAKKLLGSQKAFWRSDLARLFEAYHDLSQLEGELEQLGEPTRVEVNNRVLGATAAAVAGETGERIGTVIVLRDVTREALSERLKDEFVTQISHELRTPLTVIKGFSDVLLSTPSDMPPKRQFLEAISRNTAVLDRMIIELLDLSEMGAGTFAVRRDEFAFSDVMWEILRGIEARIRRAKLELHVQVARPQLAITGDEARLKWAIGHLLDNALKYTLPGGQIRVRWGQTRGARVLLDVTDTGVGVQEKDLPHIFERFYRGEALAPDGRQLDPRGLGQGLYVARGVAEAHGGYLSVASRAGQGSTFTMALPVAVVPDEDTVPIRAVVIEEPAVDPEATTVPHRPVRPS